MPVFLALAFISGQPLNLVPDDQPRLPSYRVCDEQCRVQLPVLIKLKEEWLTRARFDPGSAAAKMGHHWLKDPKVLQEWREEAKQAFEDAAKVRLFWLALRNLRTKQLGPAKAELARRQELELRCRRYLGEELWRKGGWWK
jgi:hypothetical protein